MLFDRITWASSSDPPLFSQELAMKSRNLSLPIISLLLLLTLVATAHADPIREVDFSALDKLVPEELKAKNTPGAVIAIVSGNRVIYEKAFGVANVETNVPLQKEMLFRLGSTTKMFTAAAVVKLAEAGKLRMDQPVGTYVKGLSGKLAQTTPDHLLSHSAGFRDFAAPFISHDDSALGTMVRGWKDDVFFADQGDIYSYSSPAYWFSGFLVEEVTGKPYADAMNELLFKPLGMERTTLRPLLAITYPFATGHFIENQRAVIMRPVFDNVAMWPAGSMFSNAGDLSRFVIAFMNDGQVDGKQLLSSSLVKQMSVPRVSVPGETDSHYAYGLTTFKYQGLQFVLHGGFSRGYGSMIQMVPERKFAVIVLSNKSGETMRQTLAKAFEVGLDLKSTDDPKPVPVTPATEAELAQYVGSYSHEPTIWEIYLKDGKLYAKLEGKEYLLTKSGDRKFTYGEQNENALVFASGKTGKIEFLFWELYAAKKKRS